MEAEVKAVVAKESPPKTIDMSKHTPTAGLSSTLRFRVGLGLLVVMVAVSVVLASGIGAVHVPSKEIVCMILNRTGFVHFPQTWPQSDETIIFQIRLPRVLAAALVGAALSVAGVLFQGLFRNPLADPYVIGTSGGAAFGASLGAVLFSHFSILGFGAVPTLAFLGALGTMVLVFRISRTGGAHTGGDVVAGGVRGERYSRLQRLLYAHC